MRFQLADSLADGRRCNVVALGGPCNSALFDHADEQLQGSGIQMHKSSPLKERAAHSPAREPADKCSSIAALRLAIVFGDGGIVKQFFGGGGLLARLLRSEEHTSELQSLIRISYAVFC